MHAIGDDFYFWFGHDDSLFKSVTGTVDYCKIASFHLYDDWEGVRSTAWADMIQWHVFASKNIVSRHGDVCALPNTAEALVQKLGPERSWQFQLRPVHEAVNGERVHAGLE